ncbi:MAG: hypothetical protein AAF739_00420 [Pseudomonadota bacterium]
MKRAIAITALRVWAVCARALSWVFEIPALPFFFASDWLGEHATRVDRKASDMDMVRFLERGLEQHARFQSRADDRREGRSDA